MKPLAVFQDVMCLAGRILGAGGYGSLAGCVWPAEKEGHLGEGNL